MKKTKLKVSLVRAVHALANPTDRRAQEAAAFEFECSRAAADQYGTTAQGLMLPAEVLRTWKRDMNSADDSACLLMISVVATSLTLWRNSSSVMQAGGSYARPVFVAMLKSLRRLLLLQHLGLELKAALLLRQK